MALVRGWHTGPTGLHAKEQGRPCHPPNRDHPSIISFGITTAGRPYHFRPIFQTENRPRGVFRVACCCDILGRHGLWLLPYSSILVQMQTTKTPTLLVSTLRCPQYKVREIPRPSRRHPSGFDSTLILEYWRFTTPRLRRERFVSTARIFLYRARYGLHDYTPTHFISCIAHWVCCNYDDIYTFVHPHFLRLLCSLAFLCLLSLGFYLDFYFSHLSETSFPSSLAAGACLLSLIYLLFCIFFGEL